MSEDDEITTRDLIEALKSPGLLRDHPAVQKLMARREAERLASRPTLTLIQGGVGQLSNRKGCDDA